MTTAALFESGVEGCKQEQPEGLLRRDKADGLLFYTCVRMVLKIW